MANLTSIQWGSEPPLHPKDIESYYSVEAMKIRHQKMCEQQIGNPDDAGVVEENQAEIKGYISESEDDSDGEPSTRSKSIMAMAFEPLLLAKVFRFLRPIRIANASAVNKHWRSVTIDTNLPQLIYPIEVHPSGGVKVAGPELHLSNERSVIRTTRSEVFRNIEIINIGLNNSELAARESKFAMSFFPTFLHLPLFHRIQVLSLQWDFNRRDEIYADSMPSAEDLEQIQHVFASPALQKLRVLRMWTTAPIICSVLPFLTNLKHLEAVELRYTPQTMGLTMDEQLEARSLDQLTQLPSLKKAFVYQEDIDHEEANEMVIPPLRLLWNLCTQQKSTAFKELTWRSRIVEDMLKHITEVYTKDNTFALARFKTLYVEDLQRSLNLIAEAAVAMPDLREITVARIVLSGGTDDPPRPLPMYLSSQLRTLRLKFWVSALPRGPRIVSILQSLVDSNLKQLECFCLLRNFDPTQSDDTSEDMICEQLRTIIDSNPNLTELDVSNFDLKLSCWERILPKLHIVYYHLAILPLISICQQMRELQAPAYPRTDVLNDLLQLPHFEDLVYERPGQADMHLSRAQLARAQLTWDMARVAADTAERQAELVRLRANPDAYYLRSMFQRPPAHGRKFRSGGAKAKLQLQQQASVLNQGDSHDNEIELLSHILDSLAEPSQIVQSLMDGAGGSID